MTDKLKFLPREATREMLEAMDECSMEGYDERLYAGHAGSVYMAAWDAFHGQLCYCGDITNLGVIHRDDGPCHYPEHTSEYKRGYADAMSWKVQNHLEHLPLKEPEQDGSCTYCTDGCKVCDAKHLTEQEPVAWRAPNWGHGDDEWVYRDFDDPVLIAHGRPSPNNEPLYTTPPQRKPLTDEEIADIVVEMNGNEPTALFWRDLARAIEAAHNITAAKGEDTKEGNMK